MNNGRGMKTNLKGQKILIMPLLFYLIIFIMFINRKMNRYDKDY